MHMALPVIKGNKWKSIITVILTNKECPAKELECLIGKLVCLLLIVPGASSFLKPLQSALYSAKAGIVKLDSVCREDLNL